MKELTESQKKRLEQLAIEAIKDRPLNYDDRWLLEKLEAIVRGSK